MACGLCKEDGYVGFRMLLQQRLDMVVGGLR
jgi:hypothetical protein